MRPKSSNYSHKGAGHLLSQPAEQPTNGLETTQQDGLVNKGSFSGAFLCWEQSPAACFISSNIQKVKDLHLEGTKYAASGSQSPHFSSSA